jgi:hypothetical protein
LRTQSGVLSLLSTVTLFGTPVEITLSELTLEAFYPAGQITATVLAAAGPCHTAMDEARRFA